MKDISSIRSTIVFYNSFVETYLNIFGKSFRGDLLVTLSDRTYVSIEMNNSNSKNSLSRNMIHLFRIHSDMLVKGMSDSELEKYRLYQLNFDNFRNPSREAIEKYAFCSLTTGKVRNLIYTFCDVDLEKCRKLVYNVNVTNLPNDYHNDIKRYI